MSKRQAGQDGTIHPWWISSPIPTTPTIRRLLQWWPPFIFKWSRIQISVFFNSIYIIHSYTHTHTFVKRVFFFSHSLFLCVCCLFFSCFELRSGTVFLLFFSLCVCVCLVCVEKGAVIRRWPCLKIPSSFVSCKNISILKKTNFFRFTCKKIKKNGSKKIACFFFFGLRGDRL